MPARPTRTPSSAHPSRAAPPQARFRLRVLGDDVAVGPGKIALVEAIERTGSLTAAAKTLDMSYRRAWLLLDDLNRSLRSPAVETVRGGAGGGGSRLTPEGRRLVQLYRRIETVSAQANQSDLKRLMAMLAT